MSFGWTGPLDRITEISLGELTNMKMQRLTNTLARIRFEDVEGQELDIPEGVLLKVVTGKINGKFQYEHAGTMPKGFVFEADKKYNLLQQDSIKLSFGCSKISYIFTGPGVRIIRAEPAGPSLHKEGVLWTGTPSFSSSPRVLI